MSTHPLRSAALGGVVALALAGAAVAAPPTAFETTPPALNFGTVPVGTQVQKPVQMLNRTNQVLVYAGARWPNFGNPSGWDYPYGFWNMSGSGPDFPCYEIPPRSACTLSFGFQPKTPGSVLTYFAPSYTNGVQTFSDRTDMRGRGIAIP